MNFIMNNKQYWSRLSDIQKETFNQLSLSEEQLVIVSEYYRLVNETHLSASDAYQLGNLWKQVENDRPLIEALMLIDDLRPPCLEGDQLFSEDKDLRAYLSEHISVLAEENLKQFEGKQKELDTNTSYVTLLCPDGSGIVHMNIENGRFISLDELDQKICRRCNKPFSKHEKFLSVEGQSPQTTARNV
ncbi:MAG: hypothetical protein AAF984_11130 [Verrucomicrobiota bacterium]